MTYKEETRGVQSANPHAQSKKEGFSIVLTECPVKYRMARAAFEAEFIRAKLSRYAGNVSRTARSLGVARKTLALKIQRYGIDMNALRGITPESYLEIPLTECGTSTNRERVVEELV